MITFDNVVFRYHYANYNLFDGLSLALDGKLSTVLCDYQSGKTTLCKLLIGLEKAQSGTICIDGVQIGEIKPQNRSILYLPKQPLVFANKTVLYNVAYPLLIRKVNKKQAFEKAKLCAEKLGIGDYLSVKVKKLSPSDVEKVAVARGLVRESDVVLFDGFNVSFADYFVNAKHVVTFTDKLENAVGTVYVLDGGKNVFVGNKQQCQSVVDKLGWITNIEE